MDDHKQLKSSKLTFTNTETALHMEKKFSLQYFLPLTSVSCENLSHMTIFLQAKTPVLELNGEETN
jgi:hypothetical protein